LRFVIGLELEDPDLGLLGTKLGRFRCQPGAFAAQLCCRALQGEEARLGREA
jgi:hypothetical protein